MRSAARFVASVLSGADGRSTTLTLIRAICGALVYRVSLLAAIVSFLPVSAFAEETVAPTLDCPPAVYPETELSSGKSGDVVLRLELSDEGVLVSAKVSSGLGDAFDKAALEVAWACRYTPATRDGVRVPSIVEAAVHFE